MAIRLAWKTDGEAKSMPFHSTYILPVGTEIRAVIEGERVWLNVVRVVCEYKPLPRQLTVPTVWLMCEEADCD